MRLLTRPVTARLIAARLILPRPVLTRLILTRLILARLLLAGPILGRRILNRRLPDRWLLNHLILDKLIPAKRFLSRLIPAELIPGLILARRIQPRRILPGLILHRRIPAATLETAARMALRILLRGLIHHAQNAEIMLGVLIKTLGRHTVANAGRIAAKLLIFLVKLLRRAAHPAIGTRAVEHMVAVERNIAVQMPRAAAAAAAIVIATITMAPPAHAFHIHPFVVLMG